MSDSQIQRALSALVDARDFVKSRHVSGTYDVPCLEAHDNINKGIAALQVVLREAALTGAQPAPAAPSDEVMLNGLTRAETDATASVQGFAAPATPVAPSKKRWPFVETPGEFAARLTLALEYFGNVLAAVRYVLIETPATLDAAPAAQPADSAMEVLRDALPLLEQYRSMRGDIACGRSNTRDVIFRARALVAKETPHAR